MIDDQWLAEQLRARGLVTDAQLQLAASRPGLPLSEALFAASTVKERDLLRLAGMFYKTQYITSKKLLGAKVPTWVVNLLPENLCRTHLLIPVRFEARSRVLSIICADPSDEGMRSAVKTRAAVHELKTYVAMPAAIRATIDRLYRGKQPDISTLVPINEGRAAPVHPTDDGSSPEDGDLPDEGTLGPGEETEPGRLSLPSEGMGETPAPVASDQTESPQPAAEAPDAGQGAERIFSDQKTPVDRPKGTLEQLKDMQPRSGTPGAARTWEQADLGSDGRSIMHLARVLVAEWEKYLGWRADHSQEVATLARRMGRLAGLRPSLVQAIQLAALLHEVGKPVARHLTGPGISESPEHRTVAERCCRLPGELLAGANLPPAVVEILASLYELPNGQGVPGRLSGDSLPWTVVLLAAADAYIDFRTNPDTPGGPVDDRKTLLDRLRAAAERLVLCPWAVELLAQATSPEGLKDRLLGRRNAVLLVQRGRSRRQTLLSSLGGLPFDVRIATCTASAARLLLSEAFDLVLCDLEIDPVDGLELFRRLRAHDRTKRLPFVLMSDEVSSPAIERARAMGAAAILTGAEALSDAHLLEAIQKHTGRVRRRRVSGSLNDIPLTDILKVLAQGQKSGVLLLNLGYQKGEIRMQNGQVAQAYFAGKQGEEALAEMLGHTDGEFLLDPSSLVTAPPVLSQALAASDLDRSQAPAASDLDEGLSITDADFEGGP